MATTGSWVSPVLVVALVLACANAAPAYQSGNYSQFLEHYNRYTQGDKTFDQRYIYNDDNWKGDGFPIFVYIGGQGPIVEDWEMAGFVHELSKEFNAYTVFLEHRYFGTSLPFGYESFWYETLPPLSVQEVITDAATFVNDLHDFLGTKNSSVIVFGGGYSGVLAAYLRFRHPNIFHGAYASSAPILLQDSNGPRQFFFKSVTEMFKAQDEKCVRRVKEAWIEFDSLLKQEKTAEIKKKFRTCFEIVEWWDMRRHEMWSRKAFQEFALLNYPYPIAGLPGNTIEMACNTLLAKKDPLLGLADVHNLYYNSTGDKECFDVAREFHWCADPANCGFGNAAIARDYMVCTGLNTIEGSYNTTDMFPFNPKSDIGMHCSINHHVEMRPTIFLGSQFFGLDLSAVSNTIFSSGDMDPYKEGCIRNATADARYHVIRIPEGRHLHDLRASNKADPSSVVSARAQVKSIIGGWLKKRH